MIQDTRMFKIKDRYIRWDELSRMVPFSRSRIYVMEKKGQFPRRRKIGEKAVAWLESEVIKWMDDCEIVYQGVS